MLTLTATEIDFSGIKGRYALSSLASEAATSLATDETLNDEFDIASTSDLSEGGTVTVHAAGLLPLISNGKISGYIPYSSNKITMEVDAAEAKTVSKAVKPLALRVQVTPSCSGVRLDAATKALHNAEILANAAAQAAEAGTSPQFEKLFKSTAPDVRSTVAARLRAVAKAASSSTAGPLNYYCHDPHGYCSKNNYLAYTISQWNTVVTCDKYYDYLPLTDVCFDEDQATTTLHEFTHADSVYSPPTNDSAYGYDLAIGLSADKALVNADSYALFANGELLVSANLITS